MFKYRRWLTNLRWIWIFVGLRCFLALCRSNFWRHCYLYLLEVSLNVNALVEVQSNFHVPRRAETSLFLSWEFYLKNNVRKYFPGFNCRQTVIFLNFLVVHNGLTTASDNMIDIRTRDLYTESGSWSSRKSYLHSKFLKVGEHDFESSDVHQNWSECDFFAPSSDLA